MLRRYLPCALVTAGLLAVAAAVWLPTEVSPQLHAQDDPDPPTSESKLIAREAGLVITLAVSEMMADDLLKAAFQDVIREIDQSIRLPLADVQRITFAYVEGGWVKIVQTRRAYDKEKMQKAMTTSRYDKDRAFFKEAKDKGFDDRRPEVKEMKIGNRTLYYAGEWGRWVEGYVPLDAKTFAVGDVLALRKLFKAEGAISAEMARALGDAGKHSLVLALDGKRLTALLSKEVMQDRERFRDERRFDRFDKDKVEEKKEEKKEKDEKKAEEEPEFFDGPEGAALTPYKPLLKSKFALVTFDAKKTYTLKASATVNKKEDVDDAETALKSLLYVIRELAVSIPKTERGLKSHKALSAPVNKAFAAAKVERKDLTVSTIVTMTPEAGLAKKLGDDVAAERKRQEELDRKRREDFRRDKDKDRFFEKKDK